MRGCIVVLSLISPENHGSHCEKSKTAFHAGTSEEDVGFIPDGNDGVEGSSAGGKGCEGKGDARLFEASSPAEDGLV